jgi:hypothetical protein
MHVRWRKRNRLSLALLASALALAICWLAYFRNIAPTGLAIEMQPPKKGLTFATFTLKNPGKRLVAYRFRVESKAEAQWAIHPGVAEFPDPGPDHELKLKPSESTNVVVDIPATGRWRISVIYWDPETRLDRFCAFLRSHSLNAIADKLSTDKPAYRTNGPEYGN